MVFMHILVLGVLIFATTIWSVVCLADSEIQKRWKMTAWLTYLVLITWLAGTLTRPARVEFEETLTPYEMVMPNGNRVQVVSFLDRRGEVTIVNLNKKLQCRVPDGHLVKRIVYQTEPYCGVSYAGTVACADSFEVIEGRNKVIRLE